MLEVDVAAIEQALRTACKEVMEDGIKQNPLYQEFKVLGSPNSFYFIELAQCLSDLPLGEWGEDETGAFILRTEKNRFGVRKHFVADFFEHRHGETDTLAQIAILDYLVFFGKTRRGAEQLLHNLRNYLRKKSA
jgi:hypothetical protein